METYLFSLVHIVIPFILVGLAIFVSYKAFISLSQGSDEDRPRGEVKTILWRTAMAYIVLIWISIMWYHTFLPDRVSVGHRPADKMSDVAHEPVNKEELAQDAKERRDPTGIISKVGDEEALREMESQNQYRKLLNKGE